MSPRREPGRIPPAWPPAARWCRRNGCECSPSPRHRCGRSARCRDGWSPPPPRGRAPRNPRRPGAAAEQRGPPPTPLRSAGRGRPRADDLVPHLRQGAEAELVAHRPRGDVESGLLAQHAGHHLLEPLDGGVLAVDVVPHRSLGHRSAHGVARPGDRVAAQIDRVGYDIASSLELDPTEAWNQAVLRRRGWSPRWWASAWWRRTVRRCHVGAVTRAFKRFLLDSRLRARPHPAPGPSCGPAPPRPRGRNGRPWPNTASGATMLTRTSSPANSRLAIRASW